MPRLNREESQARTRDLLVQAARDEIIRKGFAQATVRDIAEAAGFSQGAFYSNFPSKEAILLEVVRRHQLITRLFGLLGKAVPGDPVEVAAGFIALGRGMALLSQQGDAGRIGRIVVTFLNAVIASAETIGADNKI